MARPRATLISMVKDEAPFVLHWLAYHRTIGFDRIVVLSNDCSDGTDAILDRLATLGLVEHIPNPVAPGAKIQPAALRRAEKLRDLPETDWLITLDIDEYLRVHSGENRLPDLFATAPDAHGFALTWRIMGSAGHVDWTDTPVPDAYPHGAPDLFRRGWGVKTLFQPFPDMRLGIHRPSIKGPDSAALEALDWVNGSAKPMTRRFKRGMWRSSMATLGYAHGEIAHFATQSREAYLKRGLRGNVNAKPNKYDATYFAMFDRNEITCAWPEALMADVAACVANWQADPQISDLCARATAWHHASLTELRRAPDYAARMSELDAVAATPIAALDDLLFVQPLAQRGKDMVAQMRSKGIPDREIARHIAPLVAKAEAEGDAADAAELAEMGVVPDYPLPKA